MTWAESTCRMRLACGNIIVRPTWVQRLYIWSYKYQWLLSGPFSHLRPRRETMTKIAVTGCRSNRCHDHIPHNNIAAMQRSPCWESSAPCEQTEIRHLEFFNLTWFCYGTGLDNILFQNIDNIIWYLLSCFLFCCCSRMNKIQVGSLCPQ